MPADHHQIATCRHANHIPDLACTPQPPPLLQSRRIPFKQAAIRKPAEHAPPAFAQMKLLGLIRYGLLTASRLAEVGLRAEEMVGEGLGDRLRALVEAALVWEGQDGGLLCSRAFEPRKGTDVSWGEYAGGRRQHRVVRDKQDARALCESGGSVVRRADGWQPA